MSNSVQKYCSILTYLEKHDPQLYDIIDQLCLARNFIPKRGTPGITFLRPDSAMLKEISRVAFGPDPEEAVAMIQSLIISDYLEKVSEFEDQKANIPTFLMTKLPVVSVKGKEVTLKGGQTITTDPKFMARKDRANMAVFVISGKPLDLSNGEPAQKVTAEAKPKKGKGHSRDKVRVKVRGGEEILLDRSQLWKNVCRIYCESYLSDHTGASRNPAVELLVTLYAAANEDERKRISFACSNDALASLFIVLRPFSTNQELYVSAETLSKAAEWTQSLQDIKSYTSHNKPVDLYQKIQVKGLEIVVSAANRVTGGYENENIRALLADQTVAANAMKKVKACAENHATYLRNTIEFEVKDVILTAEAEARIVFALWHNDAHPTLQTLLSRVNSDRCSLDKPYFLDYEDHKWLTTCRSASIPFFYSMIIMAVKSDAFYRPGLTSCIGGLTDVVNPEIMVRLAPPSLLMEATDTPSTEIESLTKALHEAGLDS